MRLLLFKFPHFCYFPWNSFSYHLVGFLKTLLLNGPFGSNSFFRPKIISKVPTIKTKCATIVFFSLLLLSFSSLPRSFFFSFPFISLLWFWSFSGLKNLPFDAFSLKWLQISLGWFSKNRVDIYWKNYKCLAESEGLPSLYAYSVRMSNRAVFVPLLAMDRATRG